MVFLMPAYSFNRNGRNITSRNGMSVLGERQTSPTRNRQRRNLQMNAGYNRQNNNTSNNNRQTIVTPTPTPSPRPRPHRLSTYYSNTFIEIFANNIVRNREDFQVSESMYSNFAYNGLDVHFYHNNILDEANIDDIIVGILSNINYQDIDTIIDGLNVSAMEQMTNEDEKNNRIKNIEKNITSGPYKEYREKVKNDVCPITLNSFEDNDTITIFNGCSHAINHTTKDKFINAFVKCPLCNHDLF